MSILRARCPRVGMATVMGLSLMGCGAKNERATAQVEGTVKFNGKPLHTGSLLFVPSGGGPSAQANLKADGTYSMTTYSSGDGAVIGTHDVIINALEGPAAGALPEDTKKGYDAAAKSIIPEKFGDLAKSGLKVEVKEGENKVDFELTTKEGTVKQSLE